MRQPTPLLAAFAAFVPAAAIAAASVAPPAPTQPHPGVTDPVPDPDAPQPHSGTPRTTPDPIVITHGATVERATEYWKGNILLPGNTSLPIVLVLTPAPAPREGWSGVISIPQQSLHNAAVTDLVRKDQDLSFTLALPGLQGDGVPRFSIRVDGDGRAATGIMNQHRQQFPVRLTAATPEEVAAASALPRPQTPRPPYPYTVQAVKVPTTSPDVTLAGTLTMPPGDGPHPAVILLTGSGPQDRDETIFEHRPFLVIADALSRAGYAVLRCDDRGVGESTGDFASATTSDFADDARAAVRYLAQAKAVDPARIGLIGHSEGGIVAPMVAADTPAVAFLILLAPPAVPGKDILFEQGGAMLRGMGAPEAELKAIQESRRALLDAAAAGAPREELLPLVRRAVEASGAITPATPPEDVDVMLAQQVDALLTPWMRAFITYDPAQALRKVTVPTLALFGERDVQVLPWQNEPPLREALKQSGAKFETRVLPGLNHLFQPAVRGTPDEYVTIPTTFSPDALAPMVAFLHDVAPAAGSESAPAPAPAPAPGSEPTTEPAPATEPGATP